MFKFLVLIYILFISNSVQSIENELTLNQQVDRIQRELNDLSKIVFKDGGDKTNQNYENISEDTNFTAIDFRIYELEKDIKKVNELFEELSFQLDDLKKIINDLTLTISTNQINNSLVIKGSKIQDYESDLDIKSNEKNTLGKIIIKSEDLSNDKTNLEITSEDNFENNLEIDNPKLDPELEFQNALELLKKQEFTEVKKSLELFIFNHSDSNLIGSAHYWLGEIYLLKKEFREAALILAEGFQKYPTSLKSPDMLYKLSEALINMGKKDDSCSALKKFKIEFPKHKLFKKAEKKIISLECKIQTE